MAGDVTMVENWYQKRGPLQSISSDFERLLRIRRPRAPRLGPEPVPGNMERHGGDREIDRRTKLVASRARRAPIRKSRAKRKTGGEDGLEVRREAEAVLSFSSGEFGVG
ncbi:unnamed protein product [Cuscuta epithymum]|uniref:Uncharacterized protein n=1 Tax=Cuscuta epithymum TaxID=186058 RepID=A0AAV0C052_9ASTE|nr:unnamed protein product [Cuscuta epithymum]